MLMDGKLQAVLILLAVLCFDLKVDAQLCSITSKANDIIPDKLCAPVTVTWNVLYRGVSNSGTSVAMQFNWGDGSPVETIPANLTDVGLLEWSISHTHVYPIGGDQCNYHPTVTLLVNGTICTSTMQEQIVTVWDVDNENGGQLSIDPPVYPICVGNSGSVTFIDNSLWNCVPPDENDLPNNYKRWIQWIYGTNSGAGNFIDNAQVNGSAHMYPFVSSIGVTSEPIVRPEVPWNDALPIFVPDNRVVGDEFEVTLNNWNYCNPYDMGYNPVSTTAVIVIVADPDGDVAPAGPFCENDGVVILNPNTAGGQWSGPGIVDEWTGEFDPSVAGPGMHTINYYIEDGNGCNATGEIVIQVLDSPLANITAGAEIHLCPGTQLQLDGNPTQGVMPYTHLWTGDVATLGATDIHNPIFETVDEGTYELVYRITDANGCFDADTVLLVVDSVSIHFLNKEVVMCSGVTQVLEPNPRGGSETFVSHHWSGDRVDLLSATDIENPEFTGSLPGLYKYRYQVRDSYGCEDADSIYVRVYEHPNGNAGLNDQACGLNYELNAIASVGIGTWSFDAVAGSVLFDNINNAKSLVTVDVYGDYTFIWTEDNNGCLSSSEVTISFVQMPQPVVMNDADTCGLGYVLNATPNVGVGMWELIAGTGGADFFDALSPNSVVDVSLSGNYEFAWIEDNGGCRSGDTVVVEFYPVPQANIMPFDAEQCSPAEVSFNNMSTNAETYFWDFGDGYISNQDNPVHSFMNNTIDPFDCVVELIASNSYGCVDSGRYDMRVLPTAFAAFQNDEEPGCSPLKLDFFNQSEGATSYEWDFGDGTTDDQQDVSHTFLNQKHYVQSFNVRLVANNAYGCRDTLKRYVTVYPLVEYGFGAMPQQGCHPLKVEMVADPGAFSYQWNLGDGNILDGANAATHIFENPSEEPIEYNVKLYTNSVFACRDSSELLITVLPSPHSQFSIPDIEECSPFAVDFVNQSAGASVSLWYFGDGHGYYENGISNVSHTYTNPAQTVVYYQPKLIVENTYGCKDSSSQYLGVFPEVLASISEGGAGCTPFLESLLNNSTGANQFTWSFGDGNVSNEFNGHNAYLNLTAEDKVYEVQMIAESTYGCSDTTYTNVLVYRRPVPAFTITPLELQMPQSTISISNNTQGAAWDYYWQFGDGNTSSLAYPDKYTYAVSGEYNVWLKVSGAHCADSLRQFVTVLPTLPLIDYGADAEGCPPLEVQFYNNTVDAHTYFWDFGDGNVSSEKEPKHIYYTPGTYDVGLTVDGPGGMAESKDVSIEVYEKPFADFEVRPTVIKLPETVSFINLSNGAVSYYWQFGDGQSSTGYSFQYRYENAGVYDVTLQVTSDKGCLDEHVIRAAVRAEEAGNISFPNAFTPNPVGSSGGEYTPGSSNNYVFYPFVNEGVVEYELRIYTRWGELVFESQDIKIGWDGYYHNKICPSGVYIWKVRCRYSNGSVDVKTGDVTLFR